MKKSLPLIIIILLIIACSKGDDIIEINSNYEGHWFGKLDSSSHSASGTYAIMTINSESNLSLKHYSGPGDFAGEISGKATIKGNEIKVATHPPIYYTLKIVSPLTQININSTGYHWTITLKGPDYTFPFYKY